MTLCLDGEDYIIHDINHGWFNDRMSSWICGSKVRYDFCDNAIEDDTCRNGHAVSGAGAAMTS